MATNKLERTYTIPLRAGFIKVPRYYRAKRAINQIKAYMSKHMKSDEIKIGSVLNEHVWSKGITNPPGKVTVKAIKEGNVVTVELEGYAYKTQKVQTEKTEKATSFKDKLAAKLQQSKNDDSSKDDSSEASESKDEVVEEKVSAKKEVPVKETKA